MLCVTRVAVEGNCTTAVFDLSVMGAPQHLSFVPPSCMTRQEATSDSGGSDTPSSCPVALKRPRCRRVRVSAMGVQQLVVSILQEKPPHAAATHGAEQADERTSGTSQLPQDFQTAMQQAQPHKEPAIKKRKQLRKVAGSANAAVVAEAPEQHENEYERERAVRILRNREMLQQLHVPQLVSELAASVRAASGATTSTSLSGDISCRKTGVKRKSCAPVPGVSALAVRKSTRSQGPAPPLPGAPIAVEAGDGSTDGGTDDGSLLTQVEYFRSVGQELTGFRAKHYSGWVHPEVCERYGVAATADEAWEQEGGGKFSFKINKADIPSHSRAKGWSDAKAWSATQLKKNPNAYFFRHVAPHETQANGEWSAEEKALFLETARQHGCGDKWGLFASYIPQRVGYQCSAFYQHVILAEGLVIDPRFRMTRDGKVKFWNALALDEGNAAAGNSSGAVVAANAPPNAVMGSNTASDVAPDGGPGGKLSSSRGLHDAVAVPHVARSRTAEQCAPASCARSCGGNVCTVAGEGSLESSPAPAGVAAS